MTAEPARAVTVLQGEHRVGRDPSDVLGTVLGSCVACCLHDPVTRIGGMNHFLLPDRGDGPGDPRRFGLHAMELLVNVLLRAGARREDLVAKLFGGARMRDGLGGIGSANAAFALRFLEEEGIACRTSSLGGTRARRLRFWPATGRAQMKLMPATAAMPAAAPPRRPTGDVTFF